MNTQDDQTPRVAKRQYLFVHQASDGARNVSLRTVASQTRRWTSNRRTRALNANAQQGAAYARSLVGWEARPPSNTREELDSSRRGGVDQRHIGPPLDVGAGLRTDPFNALPLEQTPNIMNVTDYFVHSWTRLKATNIDTLLGFNTYLKVYWPLAQQDELLMSALIGVARSAQCLSLGKHPTDDPLVLQHGSRALAQLRQRLSLGHMNATVIFTMDWLINIAYMTSDRAAFTIHWSAFRSAARRYIAGRNDPIATVIQHRIRSWKTLHDYRAHNDHFQPITHDRLTYLPGDHGFPALVSGFAQLVSEGNLSLEMAERLLPIQHALFHGGPPGAQYRLDLQSLLKQKRMKSLDFHICLATLALTLKRGHTLSDELPLLSDIAQAYINRPLKWSSDLGREALIWSSLILGHTLLSLPDTLHPHVDIQPEHSMHSSDLQIQHLRAEGHIVIIAIWQQLVPPPPLALGSTAIKSAASSLGTTRPPSRRPSPWSALSPNTLRRSFPMPGYLEEQLRLTYEEAMRRQQRWDDEKLLEIGKPLATGDAEKPGICVEYLVLREGRESLPAVG